MLLREEYRVALSPFSVSVDLRRPASPVSLTLEGERGSTVRLRDDRAQLKLENRAPIAFLPENRISVALAPIWQGAPGEEGPAGQDAVAGELPSGHTHLHDEDAFSTESATFVDVPGASADVTIEATEYIAAWVNIIAFSTSGQSRAEFRIRIGASDYSDETDDDLTNSIETVSLNHRTGTRFEPGTYTVQLQARKISGAGVPTIKHADILTIGLQGAIGPQGPAGSTGYIIERMSASALSGHRVVVIDDDGLAAYADPEDDSDIWGVAGITQNAVSSAGELVNVQVAGQMTEPSWSWQPHKPVWLGANGTITQAPADHVNLLEIGIALSANSIMIRIQSPIFTPE